MRTKPHISDKVVKAFEKWDCFIVWNEDKSILRKISAYYNRVNHFQNHKPTWATNIIGARAVWKSLGCPTPPKEATEVGRAMPLRKTKGQKKSADKYKVMAPMFNLI